MDAPYPYKYDPTASGSVYNLDGVPVSGDYGAQLLNSGSAAQCPFNYCGPRRENGEWQHLRYPREGLIYGKLNPYAGKVKKP